MAEVKSFLSDFDDAVARGTAESRERALWHATDLLIAGRYSDDEIWTFGEVIGRLADEIEVAARAQLSKRLVSTMPRSTSSTSLPLTIRSMSRAQCSGSPSSSTIMP